MVNKSLVKPLPYNIERPEFETGLSFTVQLLFTLFIATIIILFIAKFRFEKLQKINPRNQKYISGLSGVIFYYKFLHRR